MKKRKYTLSDAALAQRRAAQQIACRKSSKRKTRAAKLNGKLGGRPTLVTHSK